MSDIPIGPPPLPRGSLWKGIGFAAVINIGAFVASLLAKSMALGIVLVMGFGLIQCAWLIPLYLRYEKNGESETAKGVLVAAVITVLLSGACWVSVLVKDFPF